MKEKGKLRKRLESAANEHISVVIVYLVLRVLVIVPMVFALTQGNYESFFVCVLVLVLFLLPNFVERTLKIELPSVLEIVILLFIFAAEILGELQNFYLRFPNWDLILHTVTGFICAAFGFSLVDLFNRNEKFGLKLSPFYLVIVAFCFSMTIGVLWEFFEFTADYFFHLDMQKDTVLNSITSVALDSTNSNIPVTIKGITDVAVNGESLGLGGYLDIGLFDTIEDLFVNFVGAVIFSVVGFFYIKNRGQGKFLKLIIPRVRDEKKHARKSGKKTDGEAAGENVE